jgi:hypothetical protein
MPEIRPQTQSYAAEATPFAAAYRDGKTQLMAHRVGLAIVMFEKALSYDPLSTEALNGMGAAYDELHRPDLAKAYYTKALDLEPRGADTLNNIAVSAALGGDMKRARDFFSRAVELEPGNSTIRANMVLAALTPVGPPPAIPDAKAEAEADRPSLARTGLMELTLTIPATSLPGRDPLGPIAFVEASPIHAITAVYRPPQAKSIADADVRPGSEPSVANDPAAATEASRTVRIERVLPGELRQLVPESARPTLAAVQLGALAGGQIDLIGLLPYVPPPRVTSEVLPALDAVGRPQPAAPPRPAASIPVATEPTAPGGPAPEPYRAPVGVRPSCTVEVSNGAGKAGMARRMRAYLSKQGAVTGRLTNAANFDQVSTILFHRPEGGVEALRIAALMPRSIILEPDPTLECAVRLQLGRDFLAFDRQLLDAKP